MTEYGALALIPTLVVIVLALWTHRTIESLIAGVVVGVFMLGPTDPLGLGAEISLAVMKNDTVGWIILVCGFMGSLVALFIRTGAVSAFTEAVIARVHTKKGGLFTAWVLGIFLFVDDYLNCIGVGAAMRKVTDSFKTSREMLAYVVDSTAAPVSVVVPISTWAVFFGALLVENGVAEKGQGVQAYIDAIPYMFYAWAAILVVPLVILGVIPTFGPMRKAEARAATGQTVPPEAAHIEAANRSISAKEGVRGNAAEFILPMVVLAAATWYFDFDFLKGIYLTLALYVLMIVIRRTLTMEETYNAILDGFKTMLEPLAALVAAYLLDEVNTRMDLSAYVIDLISPYTTAQLLPVAVFPSMGALSFATGSNWGVFVIVLPIVVTLTEAVGADMTVVIGATLSASTFGSHACFYTDATVLTAQATGTTPYQHAITQLPFALIAFFVAAAAYLLVAVTFAGMGLTDLVLDPGTAPNGKMLQQTLLNFINLRRAAVEEAQRDIAYPVMVLPINAWLTTDDPVRASYWESVLTAAFVIRGGAIMIKHSLEAHSMMPDMHLRFNIYTDPRTPVQVKPGIYKVGNPGVESPVFLTTNFALTYYTVESDIASNGIDAYIIAINTDGIGVQASVAGGQLTLQKILDSFTEAGFDWAGQKFPAMVLPGMAAKFSGELEDLFAGKAKIMVGPEDSGRIVGWMKDFWPPK